jgi:tetratricopeptide (TPR) repeat protein
MDAGRGSGMRDFFVSYTQADRAWAEWLAWELEAAGYTTVLQAWDFVAGSNFADAMDRALKAAWHLIAVLSPAYLRSRYGKAEWLNAFIQDPTGEDRRLVPVRVEACDPQGLLQGVVDIDLVGVDEATARERLLQEVAGALRGHRRPTDRPRFPSTPARNAVTSERPRFPTGLPPIWNVPHHRNAMFRGRETLLGSLGDHVAGSTKATRVLHGLPGSGKTSLTVEYAYRHRAGFDAVWWVRAEEHTILVGDYVGLGIALGLEQADHTDLQAMAMAVRRWLEDHDRWLLILDNADGPELATRLDKPLARLVDLLPRVVQGQVLITTRDATWNGYTLLETVDVFTPPEASEFLLARSGTADPQAAAAVAEELGRLPLALEQAGAYARETSISLADYLTRLHRFPMRTLAKGRPRDREPADTVDTTWKVSVDRVRSVPGAERLLEVCAFLAPENLPRKVLGLLAGDLGLPADDPFPIDDAVAALSRFALVKADEQSLTVHRLFQQVIRHNLSPEAAASRAATAIRLLDAAFPERSLADPSGWPECARLLPHVLAAAEQATLHGAEPHLTGYLLDRAASYLQGRGRYQQARDLFERALALTEQAFGPEHARVGTRLNNLGVLLIQIGDTAAAKSALERAFPIYAATHGPSDPQFGTMLDNLGQALRDHGDLDGAHRFIERALAVKQDALGPDHPSIAITLNSLGLLRRRVGDLDGARRQFERALAIQEPALDPDHPNIAITLNNLGGVFLALGDLDAARRHLERALAIEERVLGPYHPEIATTLINLGGVLQALGDEDGARRRFERAQGIR